MEIRLSLFFAAAGEMSACAFLSVNLVEVGLQADFLRSHCRSKGKHSWGGVHSCTEWDPAPSRDFIWILKL